MPKPPTNPDGQEPRNLTANLWRSAEQQKPAGTRSSSGIRRPRILLSGLASGLFLGLLLLALSRYTDYPLDAILLDLSYMPILSEINIPLVQWTMHLFVAIAVAFIYAKLTQGLHRRSTLYGLLFGGLVSSIYFLLAPLVAPNLIYPFFAAPFVLWVSAHLLYGMVLEKLL